MRGSHDLPTQLCVRLARSPRNFERRFTREASVKREAKIHPRQIATSNCIYAQT
jgi:hypothetical protein